MDTGKEEGTGGSRKEVEEQTAVNEPFARQTKFGGLVSCTSFENCSNGKVELGGDCSDCCRNKYSKTKEKDNFAQKIVMLFPKVETKDEGTPTPTGKFQLSDLTIIFGPTFDDCKILVNDRPLQNMIAFNIVGQQGSLVFCQLTLGGSPGPTK
jgi:hypothetical protein